MEAPNHAGFEPPDLSDKQELVCPDCKQFCLNPVVPQCGHLHCLDCAEHVGFCCVCGAVLHSFQLLSLDRHMAMRHLYDGVLVRCRECNETVSRGFDGSSWSAHVQQCPFLCICGKLVSRAELNHHCQTDCTHALVACKAAPFCAWKQLRIQLAKHERNCPIVPVLPALQYQQQKIEQLEEELACTKNQLARQLDAQGDKISKLAIDDQSIVDAGRHTHCAMQELIKALDDRLKEESSSLERTAKSAFQLNEWLLGRVGSQQDDIQLLSGVTAHMLELMHLIVVDRKPLAHLQNPISEMKKALLGAKK